MKPLLVVRIQTALWPTATPAARSRAVERNATWSPSWFGTRQLGRAVGALAVLVGADEQRLARGQVAAEDVDLAVVVVDAGGEVRGGRREVDVAAVARDHGGAGVAVAALLGPSRAVRTASLLTPWAVRSAQSTLPALQPIARGFAAPSSVDEHQVTRAVAARSGDREGDPAAVRRVRGAAADEAARLDLVGPEDVGRAAGERARGEPREAEAAARRERGVDVGDGRAVGRERRQLLAAAAGRQLADRVVLKVLDVDAAIVLRIQRAEGEQAAVRRVDGVGRRPVARGQDDLAGVPPAAGTVKIPSAAWKAIVLPSADHSGRATACSVAPVSATAFGGPVCASASMTPIRLVSSSVPANAIWRPSGE